MRVEVHLGRNKLYAGIIARLHNQKPETYSIKPIRKILDKQPVVTPLQLGFWQWISAYYLCSPGAVMQAALPAHLKLMNESLLIWDAASHALPDHLSGDAYLLAEALEIRKKLTIAEVRLLLEGRNHAEAIREILDAGIAAVLEQLEDRYTPRKEKFLFLAPELDQDPGRLNEVFQKLENAPKQAAVLMAFFQIRQRGKSVAAAEVLKNAQASPAALNGLCTKKILEIRQLEADRVLPFIRDAEKTLQLNAAQEAAVDDIRKAWMHQDVVLLQGVTGSGKTMVYIRLIQEALEQGGQALFLLPEIALTAQIVNRLSAYFGEGLGVYHSRFTANERVEIWRKVQQGKLKVLLGARSAIWLPFQDLRLVVVDEEHDSSYKQYDPAPRFQARDAAIYLAGLFKAKIVLGSATPSLESAYHAVSGKYGFASLKVRYGEVSLPSVELIPAGQTHAALSSMLTVPLLDAIRSTLSSGKQVILFQNKRGYAPFILCSVCGTVPHCRHCEVSLTFHKASDKLHCHYCGNRTPVIRSCANCGNPRLTTKGFGTEKVEEELQRIFPKARVARMDVDSMRGKHKHQQLLSDFEQGRLNILVGTQMVVKGLDFDHVGLVGILSADSLLSFPDFRVNERAFQLMEQVSGRAGRVDGEGKVLIQAFNRKHPILQLVQQHDYKGFYRLEMDYRKRFGYPPYFRMLRIVLKHKQEEKAKQAGLYLMHSLEALKLDWILQGPGPALIPRIKTYYLYEIWIKIPLSSLSKLSTWKKQLLHTFKELNALRGHSGLQIMADVDPV